MKRYVILLLLFTSFGINITSNAEIISNALSFRKSDDEHRTYYSAVGISTNSLQDIAIGFRDDHINVYDMNGNFKYSYDFEIEGSYFFKFDSLNNIMIFTVRDDTCYFFNTNAELLDTKKMTFNSVERNRFYETYSNKKSISVDGSMYLLEQPFGYTRLIRQIITVMKQ